MMSMLRVVSMLVLVVLCTEAASGWTTPEPLAVNRWTHSSSCGSRPSNNNKGSSILFVSASSALDDVSNEEEEGNHLITAGHYFKGIDDDVGNAMINAGKAWTTDWSLVAEALDEAASAFWDTLSKKNLPAGLQTICRSVAQELEDISTIEGCSSVGPASSLPNWIAIHGYLESAAKAYEDDQEHQHIYKILILTSQEIEALVESI
ncbi:expressed unknown protein [Seminavis robusta]|uniref:Uncharacterized protein n=1 Tax=Seminavis robusta TaxID=568900 RepID=A0A9N8E5J2_9STRA|nr:expressed unknown protein [Seminavis robusta]|eukprot:Sro641_g180040.1 n/a (206) ;mRNA; f:29484-30101